MTATGAGVLLGRALRQSSLASGCAVSIVGAAESPWSSATFTGTRHRLVLAAEPSPALDAWLARLPDAEWDLRGHLVADLAVEARVVNAGEWRVPVTALTIVDA